MAFGSLPIVHVNMRNGALNILVDSARTWANVAYRTDLEEQHASRAPQAVEVPNRGDESEELSSHISSAMR